MKIILEINSPGDAMRAQDMLQGYLMGAGRDTAMQDAPAPTPTVATPAVEQPTPTPAPSNVDGDVELDSRGTPWIELVHAGTKTKSADGRWKKKRGVDPDLLAEEEAKARGEIAAVPPATVPDQTVPPLEDSMEPTVDMDDVHGAWAECMQAGLVSVEGAMEMYASIGVDPQQLNNGETERRKLYTHLQSLLAGQ